MELNVVAGLLVESEIEKHEDEIEILKTDEGWQIVRKGEKLVKWSEFKQITWSEFQLKRVQRVHGAVSSVGGSLER